ncbi:MAG: peptidase C39 family protein [Candidatus Nanoarchaeia archaeon]
MKLEVPFYQQRSALNCGPTALKMAFEYLGKDLPIELIEEKSRMNDGKGVSTLKLALAAIELGFKTTLYTKTLQFNEEHLKLEFYKNYGDLDTLQCSLLIKETQEKGAHLEEKQLDLQTILNYLDENTIVIVLLDWSVVLHNKEKGYNGHFVPLVGYDEENIYVHNQGNLNPTPYLAIPTHIFEEARMAQGTDEDLLILSSNL